jgi:hypothetical protein
MPGARFTTPDREQRQVEAREIADLWFKGLSIRTIARRKSTSLNRATSRLREAGVRLVAVNALPVGAQVAVIDNDGQIFARGTVAGPCGKWRKHLVLDIYEYKPVPLTPVSSDMTTSIVRSGKGRLGAVRLESS